MMPRKIRPENSLTVLIFLFFALRLLGVLTASETFSWTEEIYRGTIAKEWIKGMPMPFFAYQADYYDGGSLVMGMIAGPFFALLGPTLFSLKLAALFFSAGTLALLFLGVKQFAGREAAWRAGLLYCFAPPSMARLSTLAIGAQYESLFFTAALFYFYYLLTATQEKFFQRILCIFFGLTAGLGCWFTSLVSVSVAALLISVLTLRTRISRAGLFLGIPAFAAGVSPFFFYNVSRDWKGAAFIGEIFERPEGFSTVQFLLRIPKLFFSDFPQSLQFPPLLGIPGEYFGYLAAALFLILALPIASNASKGTERPWWIFLFLFSLLFAASRFQINFSEQFYLSRYLAPLYFILMVLAALHSGQGFRKFLFSTLLILCALGQGRLFFQESPGAAFRVRGYSYADLGSLWAETIPVRPRHQPEYKKFEARYTAEELFFLAYGHDYTLLPNADLIPLTAAQKEGSEAALRWIRSQSEALPQRKIKMPAQAENRESFIWGIGWTLRFNFMEDAARAQAWIQRLPLEIQPQAMEGFRAFEKAFRLPNPAQSAA